LATATVIVTVDPALAVAALRFGRCHRATREGEVRGPVFGCALHGNRTPAQRHRAPVGAVPFRDRLVAGDAEPLAEELCSLGGCDGFADQVAE
jgi:hypothetical protein